jgi:hypothetical protein
MSLSKAQHNVLEAIVQQTLFTRGHRKGQPKQALSCSQFYENTILSLERRGLIHFINNSLGTGYIATPQAQQAIKNQPSSTNKSEIPEPKLAGMQRSRRDARLLRTPIGPSNAGS